MVKFCVAGAAGRMGNAIIAEAIMKGHQIVGVVEAPGSLYIGKSLKELNIANSDTKILGSDKLNEALHRCRCLHQFHYPISRINQHPNCRNQGKRIILGTTGFTPEQTQQVLAEISGKVPAVFSPNYSVGVNILFKIAESLKIFPQGYDFSISEIHHTGQKRCAFRNIKKT